MKEENLVEEIEYKNFIIKILYDPFVDDPRKECDQLGKMICWHNRYNLGDEQPKIPPANYILFNILNNYRDNDDYTDMTDEEIWEEFSKIAVWLPLYLYDHSGITINTSGFSCPWDSGQVGFIYVLKKDVLKEWNKKKWSKKLEEKIYNILKQEVKTYDQYLTGDVYGYVIREPNDNNLDSCWGYYGMDECMNQAKEMADYWAKERDNGEWNKVNQNTGMED